MSSDAVMSSVRARPVVPSAMHEVEATAQPLVRGTALAAFKSELSLLMAAEVAKRVSASGPPQMEDESPEQAMLHRVVVFERAAPLTRRSPQKHSEEYLHVSGKR
jgi:hypothetical protein